MAQRHASTTPLSWKSGRERAQFTVGVPGLREDRGFVDAHHPTVPHYDLAVDHDGIEAAAGLAVDELAQRIAQRREGYAIQAPKGQVGGPPTSNCTHRICTPISRCNPDAANLLHWLRQTEQR